MDQVSSDRVCVSIELEILLVHVRTSIEQTLSNLDGLIFGEDSDVIAGAPGSTGHHI